MTKSLYIKNFGCQMNAYDSKRMVDVLAPLGYCQSEQLEDADLVILNTCHIREKAAEKIYSELGRLRAIKNERLESGPPMMIGCCGLCGLCGGCRNVAQSTFC